MSWPDEVTLEGRHAVLAPLSQDHASALTEAARDGELWKLWYTSVPSPEGMVANIDQRLAQRVAGSMLPFTVIDRASGQPVSMTTYMNIDAANRRVEIGSTWYRAAVQRTAINTECKLMLLTHAFETLRCIAVEFRTHWFNHRSREAILRLGAKQDGVLRNHQLLSDGSRRDTVVFSILDSEWAAVKRHLAARLDAHAAGNGS